MQRLFRDPVRASSGMAMHLLMSFARVYNPDDCKNFWLVLALANGETKSLDKALFERVKGIIESGQDLQVWRDLNADESEVKKRKLAFDRFLKKK